MKKIFAAALLLMTVLVSVVTPAAAQQPLPAPLAYSGGDGNIYLMQLDGQVTQVTTDGHLRADPAAMEDEVEYTNLTWSPDGSMLAAVREDRHFTPQQLFSTSQIIIYRLADGNITSLGKDLRSFMWKPDSSGFVYTLPVSGWSDKGPTPPFQGIWEYDLDTGKESELIPAQGAPLSYPAYSRSGRYLTFYEVLYMEGLGNFARFDFQGSQYRTWNQSSDRGVGSLNWSADDTFIVFDNNTYTPTPDSRIFRSDPDFQGVVPISPQVADRNFYSPRLSPSGEWVVAMSDSNSQGGYGTLWVFAIDGSGAREVYQMDASVYSFSWTPDNRRLMIITGDYMKEQILLLDVDTRQITPLAAGRSAAWQPTTGGLQATPAPENTTAPVSTKEPAPTVIAYTATPNIVKMTPIPPPDRILPPAPAWMTRNVFLLLLCGCGAAGLALLGGVIFLLMRRKR